MLLVADDGQQIPSFFAGIKPVKAYVDGRMYPKGRNKPTCSKNAGFFESVAIRLGLERIAHAFGCEPTGTCAGCYVKEEEILLPSAVS